MAALCLSLVAAACSSNARSGRPAPSHGTTTTAVGPVVPPSFSDPAQPIVVALGSSFQVVLPASPRQGLSWQAVAPPDPGVVLSIGSTFQPIPPTTTTTAPASTTTASAPTTTAPTTTTTVLSSSTTATTVAPTTTTTTPFPPGATAQQVLLYGARGLGTATLTLRYASPRPGAPVLKTVVFTITVFDPSTTTTAPPPSTTTTG